MELLAAANPSDSSLPANSTQDAVVASPCLNRRHKVTHEAAVKHARSDSTFLDTSLKMSPHR
jgi:hypothetical protein